MTDSFNDLPTYTYRAPSATEMKVLQTLFDDSVIVSQLKRLVVPGIAFFLLSIPPVDEFLHKVIPLTSGLFLLVKTAIFLALIIIGGLLGIA